MEEKYLEMSLAEKYQLLGRMKNDCEYYLGGGMKQVSHLWGKSVDHHLKCMQELLFSIPSEDRPEWLTYQDILDFSKKMDHRPVVTAQTLGLSGPDLSLFPGRIPTGKLSAPMKSTFPSKGAFIAIRTGREPFIMDLASMDISWLRRKYRGSSTRCSGNTRKTATLSASNGTIPGTSCSRMGFIFPRASAAWRDPNLWSGTRRSSQQYGRKGEKTMRETQLAFQIADRYISIQDHHGHSPLL